jgi:omega-6 fatty acid desaturase (delta-12 desaturase)
MQAAAPATPSRDWTRLLGNYREPNEWRSVFELAVSLVPFVLLWALAYAALFVSYWLTLAIAVLAAGFLLRLFMIQHDCGHYAFFRTRMANDWTGRALGILTLTPYDVWRRSHASHHSTSGNLDKRGIGDIDTLTVREYQSRTPLRRLGYRLYRHPLVMFGIGPAYLFILRNRLPIGLMRSGALYWVSAMGTNIAVLLLAGALIWLVGIAPFLLVQVPITLVAASIGVWLFYVQHQFEDTFWAEDEKWKLQDAALYGSSHYDLPAVLRWFTANIGVHHVHHLYSRIPYYRLPQVLKDHPELAGIRRMTLRESLSCLRLRLWDEDRRHLVSFGQARQAS